MFLSFVSTIWAAISTLFDIVTTLLLSARAVIPWGVDFVMLLAIVSRIFRVRKPSAACIDVLLGNEASGKLVKYVAHRGASLDAPENTLQAFKYCVERGCKFIEFDIRMTSDGECILIHDYVLSRTSQSNLIVMNTTWEKIKDIDVSVTHPLHDRYKGARLIRFEEALEYFMENKVKMFIDVKGADRRIIDKVVAAFKQWPQLYSMAIVTSFNPIYIYQIRRQDPNIIGSLAYRPFCLSATSYSVEEGVGRPTFPDNRLLQFGARCLDILYKCLWDSTLIAFSCGVNVVCLHKDYISRHSASVWQQRGYRVVAWTVNNPAEKQFFSRVAHITYITDTLVGENREDDSHKVIPQTVESRCIQPSHLPNGEHLME